MKHFSKYGLEDDDDDVDMEVPKMPLKKTATFPKEFNQETFVSKNNNLVKLNGHHQNGHLGGGDEAKENANPTHQQTITSTQKNADIVLMQNVLFDDDEDQANGEEDHDEDDGNVVKKKVKNSSFNKSHNTMQRVFPSMTPLIPSTARASNVKKRQLRINYQFKKSQIHINSLHQGCSRVQFLNGSNRFCLVDNKSVLILDCDIAQMNDQPSRDQLIEQLREHLHRETLVSSSVPIIPEQRKCQEFTVSNGLSQSMTDLIQALFGKLTEQLPYSRYQERLQNIKNWLIGYNKQLEVPQKDCWVRILHFLTTNEISFAVTECQNSRNDRLGFLVSAGPSDKLLTMLHMWKLSKYDTKINPQLLKIYALLGGTLQFTTSDGKVINVLQGLHWTQQLFLTLTYCSEPISESDLFAMNPLTFSISKMLQPLPSDVEFHMLAQHSPWIVLSCSPMFLTVDSFFLHETLASYNVLAKDRQTSLTDSIYLYLASQMTDLRWAVYFVLHVGDELVRYRFVTDLLQKNAAQLLEKAVESFLLDSFHIDIRLIDEAKKVYERQQNRHCAGRIQKRILF